MGPLDEFDARIRKRAEEGQTAAQIATAMGVTEEVVFNSLRWNTDAAWRAYTRWSKPPVWQVSDQRPAGAPAPAGSRRLGPT